MWEQIGAALVLAICLGIWLHRALGPARRERWLAAPRRLWRALRVRRSAEREAADAIARARGRAQPPGVTREGNVYRPKSFDRRKARDGRGGRGEDDRTLH